MEYILRYSCITWEIIGLVVEIYFLSLLSLPSLRPSSSLLCVCSGVRRSDPNPARVSSDAGGSSLSSFRFPFALPPFRPPFCLAYGSVTEAFPESTSLQRRTVLVQVP